jgi:hypothetical protein
VKQPWIVSPKKDLLWVIAPPFVASGIVLFLPNLFAGDEQIPTWSWFVLILGIDVAHVYGTLFRTYLDPQTRRRRGKLLIGVPILTWLTGVWLYSYGELNFWRALAYLAIFHFVRQQYGFVRIYSRNEKAGNPFNRTLDAAAVYSATLYPLIFWHTHLPRKFNWFIDGEFFHLAALSSPVLQALDRISFALYLTVQCTFIFREARRLYLNPRAINIPKDLLVLGTTLSWYVGIVLLNGDLQFTLVNVVSHGIPYFALVWFAHEKKQVHESRRSKSNSPVKSSLIAPTLCPALSFIAIIGVCAYSEEMLWDSLIWRDHASLFSWSYGLPWIEASGVLVWLVPLLCVPQFSHYLLDGFIWKIRDPALRAEIQSQHGIKT